MVQATPPTAPPAHPGPGPSEPAPRAGRREWAALAALLLPLLLVSMDVSVLYFAIPFISSELDPSGTQQLWILDIYGFVLGGLLLTMGTLGDRIGRRRLLLIGATAFGAASVAAAFATSPGMLIAARALLGVGGATLMPSTLALVRNLFRDPAQRATAVALWSAVSAGGVAIGPVLSGLLLEHWWWGSVFLVNLPAMALLLAVAPFLIPEFRGSHPGRFDWPSALLSLAAALLAIYGVKELAARAPTQPADELVLPLLSLVLGIAVAALFLHRQRTVTHPMLDLALLRRPGLGAALGTNLVAMFVMVGFAIFTTQYLQSVQGLSPLTAALWSLAPSASVGLVAPVSVQLARRLHRAQVIGGGFALSAAGFAVLTQLRADSPLWTVLTGAVVYAAGVVTVMTLITDLVLGASPTAQAGTASGLLESATEFGGALGMAVLGTIGTAVYRAQLAPHSAPEAARETLGGALAAAEHLPPGSGDALRALAREAFTDGMRVAAAAGAVLTAAMAVIATRALRHIPDPTTPTNHP